MTTTIAPLRFWEQPVKIDGRSRWTVYWLGPTGKELRIGIVTWVDSWGEYAFYQAPVRVLPAEAMREVARFLEEQGKK